MLFDLPFSLQNFPEIKKQTCSSEASKVIFINHRSIKKKKKVFDNSVNNVTIKLLKLVLGGSNLF